MDISLKPEHGYVLLCYAASFVLHNVYMSVQIGAARKKYGVRYPTLYASENDCGKDAKKQNEYNCIQRGHQNSLELIASFHAFLGLAGLRYPITAALAGCMWLLGRFMYFKGYATGVPKYRLYGAVGYFGMFTLVGCTIRMAVDLLRK